MCSDVLTEYHGEHSDMEHNLILLWIVQFSGNVFTTGNLVRLISQLLKKYIYIYHF